MYSDIKTIIENISNKSLEKIAKKVINGHRISGIEGIELFENGELGFLGSLANFVREKKHGDKTFFNRNFHIEPTNICIYNCKFCSYVRKVGQEGAWELSLQQVLDLVRSYKDKKVTEVHIVGGVHPKRDLHYYGNMIQKIKEIIPGIHVKAFTAVELDFMIKKDGFTLAKEIRELNQKIPVIFLTAKTLKDDVLEGFKIGADDYITKPFVMDELLFRIEAILRRINQSGDGTANQGSYKIGKFTFEVQKQLLSIDDVTVKLTTKEAELLELLSAHKNSILERNYALKLIWKDDNYFNARSMDVYITKLRKHLKKDESIEIINVHGKGYKLIVSL